MLGWHISVFRQKDGGAAPATMKSPEGARLAVWQTSDPMLAWLDMLVKAGKAIDLGGNGYPNRYTATAKHLIPCFVDGPPEANNVWVCGPQDIIGKGWEGKTVIDHSVIESCRPDEWLLIEVWDES